MAGGNDDAAGGGKPPVSAFDKALRILLAAGQTRAGLARRLERAGYEPEEIEEACERLEADGYLDDQAFAASRVRRRQEQGRGARVIAAELRQKGVAPGVIDSVLAERDEEVEIARAQQLAAKLVRQKANEPPAERRDHVMGALLRRGYTHGVARHALEFANRGVSAELDS